MNWETERGRSAEGRIRGRRCRRPSRRWGRLTRWTAGNEVWTEERIIYEDTVDPCGPVLVEDLDRSFFRSWDLVPRRLPTPLAWVPRSRFVSFPLYFFFLPTFTRQRTHNDIGPIYIHLGAHHNASDNREWKDWPVGIVLFFFFWSRKHHVVQANTHLNKSIYIVGYTHLSAYLPHLPWEAAGRTLVGPMDPSTTNRVQTFALDAKFRGTESFLWGPHHQPGKLMWSWPFDVIMRFPWSWCPWFEEAMKTQR